MAAKLNIWIRDRNCEIITNSTWHLDVFSCCGKVVLQQWFKSSQAPPFCIDLPPGCYLVTAGLNKSDGHGNYYTDWAWVVVKCDEVICVNLILNDFKRSASDIKPKAPLNVIRDGCAGRIIMPLIFNAVKAGIRTDEIKKAVAVLAKASDLDLKEVDTAIRSEIKENLLHLKEVKSKEPVEFYQVLTEYLDGKEVRAKR